MSLHYLTLVPEVQEEILSWCSAADLKNLSLTCLQCSNIVKRSLWRTVRISWDALAELQSIGEDEKLLNLKYTRRIQFGFKFTFEDSRRKELMQANLMQVLDYLNPYGVEEFTFINLPYPESLIKTTCERLKKARSVSVIGTKRMPKDTFEMLPSFHRLCELNLFNTQIKDATFLFLCDVLTNLTSLDIGGTPLQERSLRSLAKLTSLRHLGISMMNTVSNEVVANISSSLKNLKKLHMRACCRINHISMIYLGNLSLEYLDVTGCYKIDDYELCHITGMTSLKDLAIEGCRDITGSYQSLRLLISLNSLNVGYTKIDDEGLEGLKNLKCLTRLNIRGCEVITDVGFQHVRSILSLKYLNIKDTNLTEACCMEVICCLTNLEKLDGFSFADQSTLIECNID